MCESLFDDAAPAATGASVNDQSNISPNPKPRRMSISPAVRRNAPDTSREAARRIAPNIGTQLAAVLGFIESRRELGATDAEISLGVCIPIQSVNPRRGTLAGLGLIVLNGDRRLTPNGCPARVWVAKAYAPKPEGGAA